MGPEGITLVNPPITIFQQSLTHSAVTLVTSRASCDVLVGWVSVGKKTYFVFFHFFCRPEYLRTFCETRANFFFSFTRSWVGGS